MNQNFNRKIIHMCLALLALMIGHWHWIFVLGSVLIIIIFNLFILPNLKMDIYSFRESDKPFYRSSLVMYPVSVLFLMIFYAKPYVTAGVWGIMGFGTGISAIVERIVSEKKLPWNKNKSWEWLAAFILSAFVASYLFLLWSDTAGGLSGYDIFLLSVIAAVISGFVISRDLGIDENVLIALAGGVVMYLFSFIVANTFVMGIIVSLVVMGIAYLIKAVNKSGAIFGFIAGWIIYLVLGLAGYAVFFAYIVLYYLSYAWGYKNKIEDGLISDRGFIIGGREMYSSLLLPIVFVLIYSRWKIKLWLYLYVVSLSAPMFNVAAAQLGRTFARYPVLISSFRRVEVGMKGAISFWGILAGLIATLIYLFFAVYHLSFSYIFVLLMIISALISNLAKSYYYTMLADGFEPNKEMMNMLNSILCSVIFVIIYLPFVIRNVPPAGN